MEYVRMVTTAEHQYAGHRLHEGEEYDCESIHVEVMQKLGWAKKKDNKPSHGYETRQLEAGTSRRRGRASQA